MRESNIGQIAVVAGCFFFSGLRGVRGALRTLSDVQLVGPPATAQRIHLAEFSSEYRFGNFVLLAHLLTDRKPGPDHNPRANGRGAFEALWSALVIPTRRFASALPGRVNVTLPY